jgi:hypothetical protein
MVEQLHKSSMIYSMNVFNYQGGCHCQAIRFTLELNKAIESHAITACNCSICEKTGYIHLIVAKEQMILQADWNQLSKYQFNSMIAEHYFCKTCGIKSFYQPRSHPDCWSVNLRCLDNFSQLKIDYPLFDGKNWEQNIDAIL